MALTAPTNDLTGNTIATTYDQLLFIDHANGINEDSLLVVGTQSGKSALYLTDSKVMIKPIDADNSRMFEVQKTGGDVLLSINASTACVGINTHAADFALEVQTDGTDDGLKVVHSDGAQRCKLALDGDGDGYLQMYDSSSNSDVLFTSSSGGNNYINNGGKLGIGLTAPESALHIDGDAGNVNAKIIVGETNEKFITFGLTSGGSPAFIGYDNARALGFGTMLNDHDVAFDNEWMRLSNTGHLMLNATGTIHASQAHFEVVGDANEATNLGSTVSTAAAFFAPDSDSTWGMAFGSSSGQEQYIQGVARDGSAARQLSINPYGGYVGVGTHSPQYELEVASATAADIVMTRKDNDIGDGDIIGQLSWVMVDANLSTDRDVTAGIKAVATQTHDGANYGSELIFMASHDTSSSLDPIMTMLGNGNVGIGTIGPENLLHIQSASAPRFQIDSTATSGGGARGYFDIKDGNNDGWRVGYYGDASGQPLRFVSFDNDSQTNRLTIYQTNGNVGIGTDTPSNNLEIGNAGAGNGNIALDTVASSDGEAYIKVAPRGSTIQNAITFYRDYQQLELGFLTGTSNSFSEAMRIDENGNVGIGTTSPEHKLHVQDGSIAIMKNSADTADGHLEFYKSRNNIDGAHTVVLDNDELGVIKWYGSDGTDYHCAALIEAEVDGEPATGGDTSDMPGRLNFATTTDGSGSPTIKMVVLNDGNVGIGTTSPDAALHVNSDTTAAISDGGTAKAVAIFESGNTTGSTNGPIIALHNSSTAVDNDYIGAIHFTAGDSGDADPQTPAEGETYGFIDSRIIDETDASAAGQMRMRVATGDSSDGITLLGATGGGVNVGMGEAAPESELEITANSPRITLHANTETDGDLGRLSDITFKGEKADGTECNIGKIECSHDGSSNDFLGQMRISVNQGADAGSLINSVFLESTGRLGVGAEAGANGQLYSTTGSDVVGVRAYLSNSSYTSSAIHAAVNTSAGTGFLLYSGDSSGPTRQFDVNGTGTIRCEGGAIGGSVDYAEFFESIDGKEIPLGTTVVIDNGKVRKAIEGESPFGVVSSTEGHGGASHNWHKRYLKGDYNEPIYEDDGVTLKENPNYNPEGYDEEGYAIYTPRRKRAEWNSIGLLGQVPITKGEIVSPSWTKMYKISDTVDMYYIFPCAQVINNKQGESSNEQEQDSSNNNGGDASSESSGEDSGGVEGSSGDSSDASSGASEASEPSSDDGNESAGSSGSDASDDSEAGSGGDDSEGSNSESPSGEPSSEWTKDELKAYMDDNGIAYNSGDTKQDLLDKIGAANG